MGLNPTLRSGLERSHLALLALRSLMIGVSIAFSSPALPAEYPAPVERDYVTRDFKFADGETLPELKLHYRTIGTPQRDPGGTVRNAVLILHGTAGAGQGFLSETF